MIAAGCMLIDVPPSPRSLDGRWTEWMLSQHYARWDNGKETTLESHMASRPLRETIASYPDGAPFTRFGIGMSESLYKEGPAWEMDGGLIARVAIGNDMLDLFGRETRRVHRFLFAYGFAPGHDFSYEFFLVLRPSGQPARVVREWHFPSGTLALSGDSIDERLLRRSTRSATDIDSFVHPTEGAVRWHLVDGFLDFDPATKVATVSVSGLKQPFSEAVDLSRELGR
jgi:hypothetical protein